MKQTLKQTLVTLCLIWASVFWGAQVQAQTVEITSATTELTCDRSPITLVASVKDFPEGQYVNYFWTKDGSTAESALLGKDPTLTVTEPGIYMVMAYADGMSMEEAVTATIEIIDACNGDGGGEGGDGGDDGGGNDNVTVTITAPTTVLTCDRRQITLTATVTGASEGRDIIYNWHVDGTLIAGVTSASHTATFAGTYYVKPAYTTTNETIGSSELITITDACNSDNNNFNVTAGQTAFSAEGGSTTVDIQTDFAWVATITNAEGSSVPASEIAINPQTATGSVQAYLNVSANNSTAQRGYLITFAGQETMETLATLTITQDGQKDGYIYGCTDSNALNYNPNATASDGSCVYDNNNPSVIITAATTVLTCEQPQILLAATVTGFNDDEKLNYRWAVNGNDIAGVDSPNYTASEAGTYTVVVEGTSAAATNEIKITGGCNGGDNISAKITAPTTVLTCAYPQITLTVDVIGVPDGTEIHYQWLKDNVAVYDELQLNSATDGTYGASYTAAEAGTYTVNVSYYETGVLIAREQIKITDACGSGNEPYFLVTATPNVFSAEGGSANLYIQANPFIPWVTTIKNVDGSPVTAAEIRMNPTSATGIDVQPYIFVSPNHSTSKRVYVITFSSHETMETLTTLTITQEGKTEGNEISVSINAPTTEFTCDLREITLTANVTGIPEGQSVNYRWIKDDIEIGENQKTLTVTETGMYLVMINNPEMTINASAVTVITDACGSDEDDPYVTITASSTKLSCAQPEITLTAIVADMPGGQNENVTYRWLNASNVAIGQNQTLKVTEAGEYIVMVSNPEMTINVRNSIKITGGCVYGCTDPYSENYNPAATDNDGSCVYKTIDEPIEGCTNSDALNYNPIATIDNGSCVMPEDTVETPQPIYGCTDRKALNYNPNATVYDAMHQDCKCVYANEENTYETEVVEPPVDTIGTKPIENCALKINVAITEVSISSVEVLSPNEVMVNWVIKLEGGITILYSANYTVNQSGATLFYLSIICKEDGTESVSPVLKAGSKAGSVTGFTVSASYNVNLGGAVGIDSPGLAADNISVFPNPVRNELQIESGKSVITKLEIINMSGKVIRELSFNGKPVNVSALPQGVYLLRIATNDGIVVKKFVKK